MVYLVSVRVTETTFPSSVDKKVGTAITGSIKIFKLEVKNVFNNTKKLKKIK